MSQRRHPIAKTTAEDEGKRERRVKPSELAALKPKKKCCRSKPRCKQCPVVVHKVRKAELSGLRGKDLAKVFKRARKA